MATINLMSTSMWLVIILEYLLTFYFFKLLIIETTITQKLHFLYYI